jgi:hypothetical protein
VIAVLEDQDASSSLWPQLEDLVPPELPPDIAIARLVALARSLLIENRQLREVLAVAGRPESHPLGADGVASE